MKKKNRLGFRQGFEYLLDFLCYAYYVQNDNLINDQAFDQLEKLYCKLFEEEHAPMRAQERPEAYTNGVKVIYHEVYKKNKA